MNETTTIDRQTTDEMEVNDPRSALRAARAMVPVGPAGVQIHDLAQQVDYAQSMAKAMTAVPKHLRANVGDCLAIIDISSRAGLSPYMVANHTYVQNDKLCFESQLYHAFLQASGLLIGDVVPTWEGTGGDRVCIITGTLNVDPDKPRIHRSTPLRERHPGYVLKQTYGDGSAGKKYLTYGEGEKLRAEGGIPEGSKLFSQGSPLWVSKPDVAQFYDTTRDWTRMFAPRATMGIYTVDELQDYEQDMKDVTPAPSGSGLSQRLRTGNVSREEGAGAGAPAGDAVRDAKNGDAAGQVEQSWAELAVKDAGFSGAAMKAFGANEIETVSDLLKLSEPELLKLKGFGRVTIDAIKAVIEKNGCKLREEPKPVETEAKAQEPDKAVKVPATPKNPEQWKIYCMAWLDAYTDADQIKGRWRNEMALRNDCGVTSEVRAPVEEYKTKRIAELEGAGG